jgi:hypothetical protein
MALGQRWGSLRIVGYEHEGTTTQVLAVCLCGEVWVQAPAVLRQAAPRGCARCVPMPPQLGTDMARGRQWGLLTILGYVSRAQGDSRRTYVLAQCQCGTRHTVRPDHLRQRDSGSCGCLRRARASVLAAQRWQEVRAGQRVMAVGRPRKHHKEAA